MLQLLCLCDSSFKYFLIMQSNHRNWSPENIILQMWKKKVVFAISVKEISVTFMDKHINMGLHLLLLL